MLCAEGHGISANEAGGVSKIQLRSCPTRYYGVEVADSNNPEGRLCRNCRQIWGAWELGRTRLLDSDVGVDTSMTKCGSGVCYVNMRPNVLL